MPSITPNRIRLTLDQKQKIIEDSKKPGFNKAILGIASTLDET